MHAHASINLKGGICCDQWPEPQLVIVNFEEGLELNFTFEEWEEFVECVKSFEDLKAEEKAQGVDRNVIQEKTHKDDS